MKIKYIIDSPYEGKFTLTDARDGNSHEITEKTAKCIFNGVSSHETFFSARANAAIRSVSCTTDS
jgi:hypothetical protein